MRAMLAITVTALRRFVRDRANLFFVFIFPLLLILLIGLQFGGSQQGRVIVAGDPSELHGAVVDALEDRDLNVSLATADAARHLLARGRADAAVIITAAMDGAYAAGEPVALEVVTGTQDTARSVVANAGAVLADLSGQRDAVVALVAAGAEPAAASEAVAAAGSVSGPGVVVVELDDTFAEFAGMGQFDLGAAMQLSLFVFLTSLAGSAALIEARKWGVTRRQLAHPVTTFQVIGGEGLGRFAIAFTQGAYIVAGTALLFRVDWGSLWLTAAVLAMFCAVSAAAAMVLGSAIDNQNAAGGIGVGLGLVIAALGGSMFPLELFPDTLQTIARFTPHAWAYEAYASIQRTDDGLAGILPSLGVLALMATVLLPLGAWMLRRSMERAL